MDTTIDLANTRISMVQFVQIILNSVEWFSVSLSVQLKDIVLNQ